MKNWEKYEKQIKGNGLTHIAVTKNGKMKMCNKECDDCIFNNNENTHCSDSFLDWLYEEYKGTMPTLTKDDKIVCEALSLYAGSETYIARDYTNLLFIHFSKPVKSEEDEWWTSSSNKAMQPLAIEPRFFKFISWDDEEPWLLDDLLKLEGKNEI